jgi:hypothetical protein
MVVRVVLLVVPVDGGDSMERRRATMEDLYRAWMYVRMTLFFRFSIFVTVCVEENGIWVKEKGENQWPDFLMLIQEEINESVGREQQQYS